MPSAIEVSGLRKVYRVGERQGAYRTLRDSMATFARRLASRNIQSPVVTEHVALDGLDFRIEQGEVVGIIGGNGAGKSTLLKILARVTQPSEGWCSVTGRVAPLLEVGTGFSPELTGRENVYVNGTILGMSRQEIARKFDEIVDFAGVAEYIDTPVKRYSSGMQVRLAFAVAAHLEPEILLVDEVLAVGDAGFQRKCLSRLDSIGHTGRTVLFVSHNMEAVAELCTRAIWIKDGKVFMDDRSPLVVRSYLETVFGDQRAAADLSQRTDRQGNGDLRASRIELRNPLTGSVIDHVACGEALDLVVSYTSPLPVVERVQIWVVLRDEAGRSVVAYDSRITGDDLLTIPGQGQLVCHIPKVPLLPGNYVMRIYMNTKSGRGDQIDNVAILPVIAGAFFSTNKMPSDGLFLNEHNWRVEAP